MELAGVDPLQWADQDAGILGGEDCDDENDAAYPGAPEICNGLFENCADPDYDLQESPALETDDDGDFFVECTGFDLETWQGADDVLQQGGDCIAVGVQ